jgi:Ni/Co efflux regulator RcnB
LAWSEDFQQGKTDWSTEQEKPSSLAGTASARATAEWGTEQRGWTTKRKTGSGLERFCARESEVKQKRVRAKKNRNTRWDNLARFTRENDWQAKETEVKNLARWTEAPDGKNWLIDSALEEENRTGSGWAGESGLRRAGRREESKLG